MAMPMPLHEVPEVTPHHVRAQVPASRDEHASDQPVSGTRVRSEAAEPRPLPRLSPDEEAMQLMLKVVERVEVAKSFAKIAAGIFSVTAARATVQLRAVAEARMAESIDREGGVLRRVDRVRKIARAAKDAAVHVATHRPPAGTAPGTTPETTPVATPATTPAEAGGAIE